MQINVGPGKYIVAVSGGVDSMALLHALAARQGVELVVAHFDHGIRADSYIDRQLVEQIAQDYGLPFYYQRAELGPQTSEATARKARYEFLQEVRDTLGATAIITAHHQNDVLETVVMNLLRGTNRKGLSSLRSTDGIIRPLLHVSKQDIKTYAEQHSISWREDPTNKDINYLRNYIRQQILPRLRPAERAKLLEISRKAAKLNDEIDSLLINHLHVQLDDNAVNRHWFIQLPHAVAREVLQAWLRRNDVKKVDRKMLERLVIAAKTFQPGQQTPIDGRLNLKISAKNLTIESVDR